MYLELSKAEMADIQSRILYEDNHVLVYVKPVDLLSQEDDTGDLDAVTLLKSFIKIRDAKPHNVWLAPVHRLDRMVSGLMIFAKTSKGAKRLSETIRQRKLDKTYVAIVEGVVEPQGTYRDRLSKRKQGGRYFITDDKEGREAVLNYKNLGYDKRTNESLVAIDLVTGRPHQIRLQFAAHGHPLRGDRRYGRVNPRAPRVKSPALFAIKLVFDHPTQQRKITVEAPLPEGELFAHFNRGKALKLGKNLVF